MQGTACFFPSQRFPPPPPPHQQRHCSLSTLDLKDQWRSVFDIKYGKTGNVSRTSYA